MSNKRYLKGSHNYSQLDDVVEANTFHVSGFSKTCSVPSTATCFWIVATCVMKNEIHPYLPIVSFKNQKNYTVLAAMPFKAEKERIAVVTFPAVAVRTRSLSSHFLFVLQHVGRLSSDPQHCKRMFASLLLFWVCIDFVIFCNAVQIWLSVS